MFQTIRILIFSLCFILLNVGAEMDKDYIANYDLVAFEILKPRDKRTASDNTVKNRKETDLEVAFTSFGTKFHLLLHNDTAFRQVPVVARGSSDNSSETVDVQAEFYEGVLKDIPSDSSVFCFLLEGFLTARINLENQSFFAEPAKMFLNDPNLDPRKIAVYKDTDMRQLEWKVLPKYPNDLSVMQSTYKNTNKSGLDITNLTEDAFCEVEIVADYTLYNFYKENAERTAAVLYFHGKFADHIFRSTDFSMRGKPDRMRIAVGKISIYKDRNYPMFEASSLSNYLSMFIYREQESLYCLSVGVVYRQYDGTVVGEAFRPDARYEEAFGGICDPPIPVPNREDFKKMSFNTGVLNMQYRTGKPLPLAITVLAFTHEIGHGFGSGHDPQSDPVCSPRNNMYLMFPETTVGSKNSMKFSPCSRKNVKDILLLKGGCLIQRKSECGNRIREGDEECDCGPTTDCQVVDPCCTPSDAKSPEKVCTIRSGRGFQCSPKESECCDKDCSVIKIKGKVCYKDDYKCTFSVCDGVNSTCPEPQMVSEKLCKPKYSCSENDSMCNLNLSSICADQGLVDCVCKQNISMECWKCCLKNGNCVPAKEMGFNVSDGGPLILEPGSSCQNGMLRCDDKGNCVNDVYKYKTSFGLYVGVTVVPLGISILLIFAIFVSCRKIERVHLVQIRTVDNSVEPLTIQN